MTDTDYIRPSTKAMLEFLKGRDIVYQGTPMKVRSYYPSGDYVHIVCDYMTIKLHDDYAQDVIQSIVEHNRPPKKPNSKPKYENSEDTKESIRRLNR